jgi:hypothetical protein
MRASKIAVLAGAALLATVALPLAPDRAAADTNPLGALLKAALDVCKGISDPGRKDECVSNAHKRHGQGAGKKPAAPGKSGGKKGGGKGKK